MKVPSQFMSWGQMISSRPSDSSSPSLSLIWDPWPEKWKTRKSPGFAPLTSHSSLAIMLALVALESVRTLMFAVSNLKRLRSVKCISLMSLTQPFRSLTPL